MFNQVFSGFAPGVEPLVSPAAAATARGGAVPGFISGPGGEVDGGFGGNEVDGGFGANGGVDGNRDSGGNGGFRGIGWSGGSGGDCAASAEAPAVLYPPLTVYPPPILPSSTWAAGVAPTSHAIPTSSTWAPGLTSPGGIATGIMRKTSVRFNDEDLPLCDPHGSARLLCDAHGSAVGVTRGRPAGAERSAAGQSAAGETAAEQFAAEQSAAAGVPGAAGARSRAPSWLGGV